MSDRDSYGMPQGNEWFATRASDTPRTDAVAEEIEVNNGWEKITMVDVNFARELERELNAAPARAPMPASDFRLMSEHEKYGAYASAMRLTGMLSENTSSSSNENWLRAQRDTAEGRLLEQQAEVLEAMHTLGAQEGETLPQLAYRIARTGSPSAAASARPVWEKGPDWHGELLLRWSEWTGGHLSDQNFLGIIHDIVTEHLLQTTMPKEPQSAAAATSDDPPGDDGIRKREGEWQALDKVIDEYLDGYEFIGEDESGREGSHTPTEGERHMIQDCIAGLVADEDFMKSIARTYPVRSQFGSSSASTCRTDAPEKDGVYLGWVASQSSCYGGWWEVVCYGEWDFYDTDDDWKDKRDEDGTVRGRGWYAEREGAGGDTLIVPLDGGIFRQTEKITHWLPLPPKVAPADSGFNRK